MNKEQVGEIQRITLVNWRMDSKISEDRYIEREKYIYHVEKKENEQRILLFIIVMAQNTKKYHH